MKDKSYTSCIKKVSKEYLNLIFGILLLNAFNHLSFLNILINMYVIYKATSNGLKYLNICIAPNTIFSCHINIYCFWGWRGYSAVNSAGCSSRKPKLCPQHPHGSSHLPITLVPGNPKPSFGLLRNQACMCCTGKTPIFIK